MNKDFLELPDGPVVRTLCFHSWEAGSIPGRGSSCEAEPNQKQTNKKPKDFLKSFKFLVHIQMFSNVCPTDFFFHLGLIYLIHMLLRYIYVVWCISTLFNIYLNRKLWVSQVAQCVKNLPVMQETQGIRVWSLGQEDPLEEGMATHFNILAWRISWTEEPGGLQSIGSQRVRHEWSNWGCTPEYRAV